MLVKSNFTKKGEKGFTLVELLVVIIIIGILAAVAIPAFLNQRQRANDATVKSDLRNIAQSVLTYPSTTAILLEGLTIKALSM